MKTAFCPSGATPDRITASCPSGEITIMQGGEYDVKLVRTGTSNLMPAVESLFLTFYDVDGDDTYEVEDEATGQVIEGTFYNLYEINAVVGAIEIRLDETSTLEKGQFLPSEAEYVIASNSQNIDTYLEQDVTLISGNALAAIGAFRLAHTSQFRVMVGGRSSVPYTADRGYCFTMLEPALSVICPPPSPPSSPPAVPAQLLGSDSNRP